MIVRTTVTLDDGVAAIIESEQRRARYGTTRIARSSRKSAFWCMACRPFERDVSFGEVVARAKNWKAGLLSKRVGETVSEIETCGMTALAISAPGSHGPVCDIGIDRYDFNLCIAKESLDDILASRPQPRLDDNAQLHAAGSGQEPNCCGLEVSDQFIAADLTENHRDRG